jgi:hypothetical protein
MVPGRLLFALLLPALRSYMAALLAVVAFLGVLLHRIDGRVACSAGDSLRERRCVLSLHRLLSIR